MFKTRYAKDEQISVLVRIMTILEQNPGVVGYDEIAEAFNLEESVVATMVMDAVVDIFVEGKRGLVDITSASVFLSFDAFANLSDLFFASRSFIAV